MIAGAQIGAGCFHRPLGRKPPGFTVTHDPAASRCCEVGAEDQHPTIGLAFEKCPPGRSRLLRLDVAAATRRDGNRAWEVRATSTSAIGRFWREPADVTRARTGPVPSTLFDWPAR